MDGSHSPSYLVAQDASSLRHEEVTLETICSTLSMLVTYQCNMECKHCGPFCGPREKDWISLDEMKGLVRQAAELGAHNVVLTGGEPTLLKDDLMVILSFIRDETPIESTRMVSNAKWARTYDSALKKLRMWKQAGLVEINISCGEYHQEFAPISSVVNAYKAAQDLDYSTVLLVGEFLEEGRGKYSSRMYTEALREATGEEPLSPSLRSPYVQETHGLACGAALPYGRGKHYIRREDMILQDEDEIQSLCADVNKAITVHPNGKVTACCGVMTRDDSMLDIGNWRSQPLEEIIRASLEDLVLNWIRYLGLKDMKQWLLKKDPSLKFEERYGGICDLCANLLWNKRCQELLLGEGEERRGDILANKVALDATVYAGPGEFQYANTAETMGPNHR